LLFLTSKCAKMYLATGSVRTHFPIPSSIKWREMDGKRSREGREMEGKGGEGKRRRKMRWKFETAIAKSGNLAYVTNYWQESAATHDSLSIPIRIAFRQLISLKDLLLRLAIVILGTTFMVLTSWQSRCESSPGLYDNVIPRLHDESSSTSWLDELAWRALHDEASFMNMKPASWMLHECFMKLARQCLVT